MTEDPHHDDQVPLAARNTIRWKEMILAAVRISTGLGQHTYQFGYTDVSYWIINTPIVVTSPASSTSHSFPDWARITLQTPC